MKANAMIEEFEHIELFGKPVLFTDSRIDRGTVPKGWHCYDIRGSDNDPGRLTTLEKAVGVNHAGSILSPEEIPFSKGKDYRPIRGSQNFLGESFTLAEFCHVHGLEYPIRIEDKGFYQQVRKWYEKAYPSDELGHRISNITFSDIVDGLNDGIDIYEVLGVEDSIVRERVFSRAAELLRVDYDVIFSKWIHHETAPDIELPKLCPEHSDTIQEMTLGGM